MNAGATPAPPMLSGTRRWCAAPLLRTSNAEGGRSCDVAGCRTPCGAATGEKGATGLATPRGEAVSIHGAATGRSRCVIVLGAAVLTLGATVLSEADAEDEPLSEAPLLWLERPPAVNDAATIDVGACDCGCTGGLGGRGDSLLAGSAATGPADVPPRGESTGTGLATAASAEPAGAVPVPLARGGAAAAAGAGAGASATASSCRGCFSRGVPARGGGRVPLPTSAFAPCATTDAHGRVSGCGGAGCRCSGCAVAGPTGAATACAGSAALGAGAPKLVRLRLARLADRGGVPTSEGSRCREDVLRMCGLHTPARHACVVWSCAHWARQQVKADALRKLMCRGELW